jgi:poly(hydroxyalkanoate) granule-associated protein
MDTTTTESGQDRKLQDDLKESAHRIWLAGLGALAAAEEEGSKMFNRLVDRGRDVEGRGRDQAKEQFGRAKEQFDRAKAKAESTWDDVSAKIDEKLTATLHRLGVPTREEIQNLTHKVEELHSKVEQLKPRVTPASPIVTPESAAAEPNAKIIV